MVPVLMCIYWEYNCGSFGGWMFPIFEELPSCFSNIQLHHFALCAKVFEASMVSQSPPQLPLSVLWIRGILVGVK